uniref:PiggyBac transposable element-derived protein domain-containing protein n=1 Tax=Cacopsylla melanoneura TaxID=428564 RepID=A0A8D9E8V9_9HEMI
MKPLAVVEYNKGKVGIDLSDQMASYHSTVRKGIKWNRRLGLEALLGMTVVNAWILCKLVYKEENSHENIQSRDGQIRHLIYISFFFFITMFFFLFDQIKIRSFVCSFEILTFCTYQCCLLT